MRTRPVLASEPGKYSYVPSLRSLGVGIYAPAPTGSPERDSTISSAMLAGTSS